jgi:hypothetical protein
MNAKSAHLALPIIAMASSCCFFHSFSERDFASRDPSFISAHGVAVYSDARQDYLTPSTSEVMEDDMIEQMARLGYSRDDVAACVQGTLVHVSANETVDCSEAPSYKPTWVRDSRGSVHPEWPLFSGCYHVGHYVEVGSPGRCAYTLSKFGPAYEHELVHVALSCLGHPDPEHIGMIWKAIHFDRPCEE